MKNKGTLFLVQAAAIAAVYVVLTTVFAAFSFGEVQVRISEALTILPVFTPAAIPGLFVGCIISNFLGGAILMDVIFGSIATLIGAVFTYKLRNSSKWLAPVPPIVANALIVPFTLYYGYGVNLPIPFMMLTVGIGEVLSCFVLGLVLAFAFKKYLYKTLYRDCFTYIAECNTSILAKNTFQGTSREKHGPRTFRSADRRLFPKVQLRPRNFRQSRRSAESSVFGFFSFRPALPRARVTEHETPS